MGEALRNYALDFNCGIEVDHWCLDLAIREFWTANTRKFEKGNWNRWIDQVTYIERRVDNNGKALMNFKWIHISLFT